MSNVVKIEDQEWDSRFELIKAMYCKGATPIEMQMFAEVCKRTKLDPIMKQIYPVKRFSASEKREVMTIQTSIDGFRLIAERTGYYAPGRETTFAYTGENTLLSATAYVKKQTKDGTWHEVAATAYYEEYVQRSKDGKVTQFWSRMPHVMLSKCAESIALRKAFPAELSGIYTQEEMSQASTEKEIVSLSPPPELKLSEEQLDNLHEMSSKIYDASYFDKLFNWLKIENFNDLDPKKYDSVVRSMQNKIAEGDIQNVDIA